MVPLMDLWLPILVSAVLCFFASFLAWMVFPHHRSDWKKLPDEDALAEAIRAQNVGGGQYNFPHCDEPSQMKDPAYQAKMEKGPMGFLVLRPPGPLAMGKNLVAYFVYNVVISIFVAYVAGLSLAQGADFLKAFQVAGTVAILAYAGALPPVAIWFGRSWSSIFKEILDGVVYGLLTAGAFGWLWPS